MIKSLTLRSWVFAAALAGWSPFAGAEPMIPADLPFVFIQTIDPLASEPGNNPGSFTVRRFGDTNAALTMTLSFTGTASNGVTYVPIPASLTLAAGQTSTNILVTPVSETNATGYKTVIVSLPHERFNRETPPAFLVGGLDRALVYIVYNYTNVPPSVSLTSPTNASTYLSKPNIVLSATASDSNGWVTLVQFFANGTSLGTVSNCPFGAFPAEPLIMRESHGSVIPTLPGARASRFQFAWSNVPPGAYALTAAATDNAGLQKTSSAVEVTVTTNLPVPEVRIVSPTRGAEFPDFAPINLFAAAGETNGVVNTVEFFDGTNVIGTATNYLAAEPMIPSPWRQRMQWLPFYFQWTNASVGSNSLTAVVTDNNGSTATSAPVGINVTTNVYHHRHSGW